MSELATIIGQNVRAARNAAGLTQATLAERTGIRVPHISRLESGAKVPTLTTLDKVAGALGVTLCALVMVPPPPKRTPRTGGRR